LETTLVFILATFLLIFPKGGIKISGIPFTWGYAFLFAVAFFLLIKNLSHGFTVSRTRWLTIGSAIPFQVYILMIIAANGYVSFGFTMSMVINTVVMPWIFIMILGNYLDRFNPRFLFKMIKVGVLAIALYGIFLFFFRALTGEWIEIPLLTINYGDIGALDAKYNIRFGFLPKLISTYNNGNIYGICILMVLPIFDQLEKSRIKSAVVKTSLILSLSRTVWIGLLFYELVLQWFLQKRDRKFLIRYIIILASLISIVLGIVFFVLGGDFGFIFDPRLGGRIGQVEALENITILPSIPFISIAEIVYLSVLDRLGVAGFVLFLIMILAPCVFSLNAKSAYRKSFLAGVVLYIVLAMSDGAIMFIPVMAFFWFMVSMAISRTSFPDESPSGINEMNEGNKTR
jgi:hypothetical protein